MLARAPSLSRYLTRGVAALGLSAGAATVHHESSSAAPSPTTPTGAIVAVHAAREPALSISLAAVGAGTTIMKDECVTAAAGDGAAFECGDLRLVHALPSTTTMGTRRTPTLIYNSRHESGTTVFPLDVTLPIGTVLSFTAKVIVTTAAGVVQAQSPAISWGSWVGARTRRINIPLNTSALATGAYAYRIVVDFNLTNGTMAEQTVSSMVAVVNRSQSPFGKGWWLDGLEQLIAYDNTRGLWIGGDGSTRLYTRSAVNPSIWTVTPAVDRPDTLEQVSTTVIRRRLRNGAYVEFDNTGRHTRTVNRNGYVTSFLYENASHPTWMTSILLPVPPQSPLASNPPRYRFTYGSTPFLAVDAPANGSQARRFTASLSPAGGTIFTDPDTRTVWFLNTTGLGITRRTDQRGYSTSFTYESDAKTLTASTLAMNGTAPEDIPIYFTATDRAGVNGSAAQDTSTVATIIVGARLSFPGTRFGVTRFGGVRWFRNAAGEQTTLRRDDPRFPAVVTKITRPSGFTTVATYNDRALLATVTDSQPWAGLNDISPTTRYRWGTGKFDVLASIVHPLGDSITFGYFSNGDRQWEQVGSSQTRRVQYRYNSSRQLSAVASPGNNPITEVDSVEYDRTLGNVSRTLTPLRIATRYHTDGVGRVDSVFAPGASNTQRVTVTTYDVMDRPITATDIGATINYTLGAGFIPAAVRDSAAAGATHVQHYYDAVGNDTLVERWATPNPTNVSLRQTYARFDGANRKVWELGANGAVRQWQYDGESNLVATITPRRDTIRMEYDVVNRLVKKMTPAVRYEAQSASEGPTALYSARFPNFADGYSHDWHVRDDPMPPALIIPGDTTYFNYDAAGNMNSAMNHDAWISRAFYPNGTLWGDGQYIRGFGESAWPYTHTYSVYHWPNANGQLAVRYISAPGNCDYGTCQQFVMYDPDNGELVGVQEETDVNVAYERHPELRTLSVQTWGSGTVVNQSVQRDADGRATARAASSGSAVLFTDNLSYDNANRVITSATEYALESQRSVRLETAYSGLGALAASVRQRNGVATTEKYETDAFANVAAHTARNLTDNRGAVVNSYNYTTADRQLASLMQARDWQLDNPPADILEQTFATTFDAAGNRVSFQKSLQRYDRALREYVPANYGREWNWSAYDAEDRLRVSQRSYFSDSVTLRTVFIEYSYDPLGRRVQTRTRWDMHCQPGAHGECHPSVERTIWDGDQIAQEMRNGAYDVIPESVGETDPCVPDSDWSTKPWCAPDYVPPPVPVRYVQGNLDLEWTGGNFEGVVRYIHGEGIDEPVVVRKSSLGTFVPLRSARGLVEDGVFLGTPVSGVNWTARDIDYYGARDMLNNAPLEPTHWLGSLIGDRKDASGLVYMRNRYYDPSSGRFTQQDPIGLAGGINLYGFVGGDPASYSDPFGLFGCKKNEPCDDVDQMHAVFDVFSKINKAVTFGWLFGSIVNAGSRAGLASESGIANPVPTTLARVLPAGRNAATLARTGQSEAFVTDAGAIDGLSYSALNKKLGIDPSAAGYEVITFPTSTAASIASPINRTNPLFVGRGQTIGGLPEFVIPNMPIPADATRTIIKP